MIAADVFQANCAEKQQSPSFSGVGAHHQNAHAEHAIQTIIYITRTCMLYDLLYWSEHGVDDLALWPFALNINLVV